MMFVYKTGCSEGERYYRGLFSKVTPGAQNWGGMAGNRQGLGGITEPKKTKS
jgi:hypothetical protein